MNALIWVYIWSCLLFLAIPQDVGMLSTTFSSFPLSSCCFANVPTRRTVTGQDVSFGLYLAFCALQVAGLFHHASIGNPINIAIVRLILLENEEVKRKQNDSHFHPGSQTGIHRELALKACKLSYAVFMGELCNINTDSYALLPSLLHGLLVC